MQPSEWVQILGAILVAVSSYMLVLLSYKQRSKANTESIRIGPYVEYETPDYIASSWYDQTKIGECSCCGMADVPIVREPSESRHLNLFVYYSSAGSMPAAVATGPECKWCTENKLLKYHLWSWGKKNEALNRKARA